jgi:hypothetical protein
MPTISEIRQKYPQYHDMSDGQLADALHAKYYSDIPKDQFYQKVGIDPMAMRAPEPSMGEDVVKSAASGVVRGLPTLIDAPAAALAAGAQKLTGDKGSFGQLFSQNMQNGLNANVVTPIAGQEYQPKTYAGKLAKASGMAVSTLPLGGEGAMLAPATIGRTAALGAGSQLGGDIGQVVAGTPGQIAGTLIGGGIGFKAPGAAMQGAKKTAEKVGEALVPSVDEGTAALAKRADELGIPLSVSQIAPGKTRTTIQKVSQALPFSGVQPFEETQRAVWNKAVAKTLGEDADNLGPQTIQNFLDRTSKGFGDVLKGKAVNVKPDTVQTVDTIAENAKDALTGELAGVVQRNIDKFKADVGTGEAVSGEKLANFRSELVKRIPKAEGGAKQYLGELVDVIDDMAEGSLSKADTEKLQGLRRQWRNYKTVEPLLEKSTNGLIDPNQLHQRVAASPYIKASRLATGQDELVDLARIGKLLKSPGGSDTYEKSVMGGGSAGLGATFLANPVLGTAVAAKTGAGLLANRGFQTLYNQSPNVVKKVINKAPNPVAKVRP